MRHLYPSFYGHAPETRELYRLEALARNATKAAAILMQLDMHERGARSSMSSLFYSHAIPETVQLIADHSPTAFRVNTCHYHVVRHWPLTPTPVTPFVFFDLGFEIALDLARKATFASALELAKITRLPQVGHARVTPWEEALATLLEGFATDNCQIVALDLMEKF